MGIVAWLLIGEFAISFLATLVRGVGETVRVYDIWDVVFALVEYPLIIWAVVYLATR